MPIDAVVLDASGKELRGFPDPAGGTFDAAGNFDRLVGCDAALAVWSLVDPDRELRLTQEQSRSLIAEIAVLLDLSKAGPERRGVDRLRVLAERSSTDATLSLVFRGD
jgi:hypothetical protein